MKNKPKYKIQRKPLDKARKNYIEKIIKILGENKLDSYMENLLQSFVYLILNDDFHSEILRIRKELKVSEDDTEYEKWKSKEKLEVLYEKSQNLINEHRLSYERHNPLIVEFIKNYILLKIISINSLKTKSWSYNGFVGGFDAPDPKIGKENSKYFDKIQWEVYLQPTDNITQFKRSLEKHFVWMMNFHFKEYYKSELFEVSNKKNSRKYNSYNKKPAEIKLIPKKNKLIIKFISYLNTKTKEIERLFEINKSKVFEFQKESRGLQKDNRAYLFSEKIKQYIFFLDGYSASKFEKKFYPRVNEQNYYSKKYESIRTNIKEMNKNVSQAFGRKLSL